MAERKVPETSDQASESSDKRRTPWFPVFVDDTLALLADTGESTVVTGARFKLWLIACRRGGRLRADDSELARWAGMKLSQWRRISHYILNDWDFDPETQTYRVRRIEKQIDHLEDKSRKARRAAEMGWKKKEPEQCGGTANASERRCGRNAKALPTQSERNATHSHTHSQSLSQAPSGRSSASGRNSKKSSPLPPSGDSELSPAPESPVLRGTAAGLGMSHRQLVNDLESVNFSTELEAPAPSASDAGPPGGPESDRTDVWPEAPFLVEESPEDAAPGIEGDVGERIDRLRQRILGTFPRGAPSIDRLILEHLRRGMPAEALAKAMQSLLDHHTQERPIPDAEAYFAKTLRAEGAAACARLHEREDASQRMSPVETCEALSQLASLARAQVMPRGS